MSSRLKSAIAAIRVFFAAALGFLHGIASNLLDRAAVAWCSEGVRAHLRDALRAWPLLALFAVSFAVVYHLAPQKVGLTLFGICKLGLGAYIGYWADRFTFRDEDRPHRLEGIAKGTAWKRRAIIVAASIVAAALIP